MSDSIRKNLIFLWLTVLSAVFAYSAWGSNNIKEHDSRNFDEINVHRINIIEQDGKPRVIISNRALYPGVFVGGKEYRDPERETQKNNSGFLFFNDDGDEAGGMGCSSWKKEGESNAVSAFNFDQNQQQETIRIQYRDSEGKRMAGLRVWDQPDQSILPQVKLADQVMRARTTKERDALLAQKNELDKKMVGGFEERFFAGKQLGDSIVKLSDKFGKPRLILKVTESGEPSIDFLDVSGKVTKSITQ